jgi:DNA replication and repair protein RecF
MHCQHLQLDDFRNYAHLELELAPGISVFQGENASGKTSLLEAIYLLATSRSPRTNADVELINTAAETYPGTPPFARVAAQVARRRGLVQLQLIIAREDSRPLDGAPGSALTRKRISINGVARRAVDLIGAINVVLFTPQDLELVIGEPALRRRYIDITIAQVDHRYVRTLSQYNKLLLQRNALLRGMREQGRNPLSREVREELRYWDEELAQAGAYLVLRREIFLARLSRLAAAEHTALAGAGGALTIDYVSAVAPTARAALAPELAAHWNTLYEESERYGVATEVDDALLRARIPHVEQRVTLLATEFLAQLEGQRVQEIRRGVSLLGPHRDDVSLLLEGQPLASYGSRGQQRTAVLAMKMAEVGLMRTETGDTPVLLLDDIVSELDARRRQFLVRALTQPLAGADRPPQVLITTTDWNSFDPAFLSHVARYEIAEGELRRL